MSGSINVMSQQLSFVNKISTIHKATSDDESPTPSYLYKEISDISFESVGNCESLVEFLVDRLRHKSYHVKVKVLKVMKYVTEHGSKEFQLGLKASADSVKECTKFGGPPHPLHGNVPYVMVRNLAKELCEKLYNLDPLKLKKTNVTNNSSAMNQSKYGGLGPSRSGGAIQGFGNMSASQHKGLGETILDGIEKLGSRMSETPADRQAAVLAKLNLSGSSSNYQPPVLTPSQDLTSFSQRQSPTTPENLPPVKKPVSKHLPGKAGGGWNDDDDDDDDVPESHTYEDSDKFGSKSFETDSLADNNFQEVQPDWGQEIALIDQFMTINAVNLEKQNIFIPFSAVNDFTLKCSSLNCDKLVKLLSQKLSSQNPFLVSRALQALEGFIYNEEELVNIDLLASMCKASLVNCFHQCGSHQSNTTDNTEIPDSNINVWKQLQMKTAKIILILQQLSSHKEMICQSEIISICPAPKISQKA